MSKGMRTCTICGRDFALLVEDHYITIEGEKIGLSALTGEAAGLHDVIDCPHCGCQQILCRRERPYIHDAPACTANVEIFKEEEDE